MSRNRSRLKLRPHLDGIKNVLLPELNAINKLFHFILQFSFIINVSKLSLKTFFFTFLLKRKRQKFTINMATEDNELNNMKYSIQ